MVIVERRECEFDNSKEGKKKKTSLWWYIASLILMRLFPCWYVLIQHINILSKFILAE